MWSERVCFLVCVPVFGKFYCCCSVSQSCPSLCDPVDCSMPGFPVLHLPELVQTHVHWVSDDIQPSCPLLSPSPPAFSLFQHQDLLLWVSSSHQVAKILELQLLHQSFQWINIQGWFPLGLTGLILQSKRLACECPGVSGGSMGWQWPAAGSGTHTITVLEPAGISPFEGGHHYPYHSLASDQTIGKEHSPTHQQKIGFKIYWAWPCH